MTVWQYLAIAGETIAYLWHQPSFVVLCFGTLIAAGWLAIRDTRRSRRWW